MNGGGSKVVALVPAGGSGSRFGSATPKQFLTVAGRPLLAWTLSRLRAAGVDEIVVALPAGVSLPEDAACAGVRTTLGGPTRQASVANCVASALGSGDDLLLIHDGARAAVHPEDVARTIVAAAAASGGAILGRFVSDTLKRVQDGAVVETVDRATLFRAETPQVFRRAVFERALAAAARDGFEGTDEASLVERLPDAVVTAVAAAHANPKLTEPADLPVLVALLTAGVSKSEGPSSGVRS